jgi:hypothetical protein
MYILGGEYQYNKYGTNWRAVAAWLVGCILLIGEFASVVIIHRNPFVFHETTIDLDKPILINIDRCNPLVKAWISLRLFFELCGQLGT